MTNIRIERNKFSLGISLVNALRVPYDAFIEEEFVGVLFVNPITLELYEESKVFLDKLGYKEVNLIKK